jgi:hypothetical protein
MTPEVSLICNFTITTSVDVGISFESDNGGGNYGGVITIFTPHQTGPIRTGLWDDDGNVYFTIHDTQDPSVSCTVNSGSISGSWDPYILVTDDGLTCIVSEPIRNGDMYDYVLTVEASAAVPVADAS